MSDWIEWNGGGRPIEGSTLVEVRFAGGGKNVDRADQFEWWGSWGEKIIVAYRVVPQNPVPDAVNHPSHYTDGGIETIDYIRAKLSAEGFRAFCLGNVLKYVSRAGKKGEATEDLKKAKVYLEWAIND